MLKDTPLREPFPMNILAERSLGLSGSDLKELCRDAAMVPVREYVRSTGHDRVTLDRAHLEVRFVDFSLALLAHECFLLMVGVA